MDKKDLLLYLVTDRNMVNGCLEEVVQTAIEAGVTMVQLREKDANFEDFCAKAMVMKQICDKYNLPLIINDNIEVCLAVDASGVHLGGSDCDIPTARKILKGKIIGGSCRDIETAMRLQSQGADYLGVGAVFGTTTKKDAKTIDESILKSICDSVNIPVVAIGGINEQNISRLQGSGIAGVAVVSSILKAQDISLATKVMLSQVRKIVD